jgi:hypothetical protein
MTDSKKGTTGKKGTKKLKLKKETLKDLDARKTAKGVLGGAIRTIVTCPFINCL